MPSNTQDQGIDSIQLQTFNRNLYTMSQQKDSRMSKHGVIMFVPGDGAKYNMGRIGRIELVKVYGKNPKKQYTDYAADNRQFTKQRFTATVKLDSFKDIQELVADPTSPLVKEMLNAKNRVQDRYAVEVALGSVKTGAPDEDPVIITAANDGVITVDATSTGLNYTKFQELTENFVNNDVDDSEWMDGVLAISGGENTNLMADDKFINNDYTNSKPTAGSKIRRAGDFNVVTFAGSVNGGITVDNPILPESGSVRKCLALAKESIAMYAEVKSLRVEQASENVNSKDVTIEYIIGAMRVEGVKIQQINTTI